MQSHNEMKTFMTSQLVTREQFEKYQAEYSTHVVSTVEQAVTPIRNEVVELRSRLESLEKSSKTRRAASVKPRSQDPAWKQLAFKKIPAKVTADERLEKIEAWMKQKFPRIHLKDCFNIRTGPFPKDPKQNRALAPVVIVEFGNADVRREVLNEIKAKNLKCQVGGADLDIKGALTEEALSRNSALRRAEKVLKDHADHANKAIKIEFTGNRGVTVDGVYAFEQDKVELEGKFVAPYADLVLPLR